MMLTLSKYRELAEVFFVVLLMIMSAYGLFIAGIALMEGIV